MSRSGHRPRDHLFVYGTLRPGDVRWPILRPYVAGTGVDDRTPGRLYDTGLGYPAAIFGGAGAIVGVTFELAPDRAAEALGVLDEVEGTVGGLFHRVRIGTERTAEAWAYAYGEGLSLAPIEGGDWFART